MVFRCSPADALQSLPPLCRRGSRTARSALWLGLYERRPLALPSILLPSTSHAGPIYIATSHDGEGDRVYHWGWWLLLKSACTLGCLQLDE